MYHNVKIQCTHTDLSYIGMHFVEKKKLYCFIVYGHITQP